MLNNILCKFGLHNQYHYLPKVGGDIGEISIACKRCGYGLRYFTGKWDIEPESVNDSIKKQAKIEYGRVLGFFRNTGKPISEMQSAFDIIKTKFTEQELEPIKKELDYMCKLNNKGEG